jgi:tetratricopeptide (TPR) repeat protein
MSLPACRTAWLALLLFGASSDLKASVDLGEMAALRAADRHAAAADLGLKGVLEQPWDHSLRYLVADSLERAGRLDEAAAQFSALQGTPLQGAAQGRLAALAGRTPSRPAAAPVDAAPTRVAIAARPAPAMPQAVTPPPAATAAMPAARTTSLASTALASTARAAPAVREPAATVAAPASAPVNQTARVTTSPTTATTPGALAAPRRLGSPATATPAQPRTLAAPPPAQTNSNTASTQPRRLGSPATATPAQPRTLAAPPPAPTNSNTASAQPRKLGSPATTTANTQPRRLGAPASLAAPAGRPAARPPAAAPATPTQRIDALYAKGEYAKAGAEGLALLEKAPIDAELHLKVANSLAWSGKLQAGQAQYRALFDSKVDRDARLGLANTQRWNGRFDLAMAGYQAVLDRHPDDSDALEGMRQSRLGLAPRTTFGVDYTTDINPVERRGAMLGHRWHNASGDTRYEVKLARYDDSIEWEIPPLSIRDPLPIPRRAETSRQSLSASIEMLGHPLQPQLTLSLQQQSAHPPQPPLPPRLAVLEAGLLQERDDDSIFGSARIKLYEWPVWFRAGRLDWSHEALAPRAALRGLVARHSGLEAMGEFDWGQLYGQVDYYGITDGNSISAAQLRWTPSWRPLGARWRPLLGVEFRQAMRPAAEYWSPSLGHGSAYAGFSGDWSLGRWSLYGSAQYGTPLLEESGTSWSLSLGGRYQFAEDLAFSFGFWRMSSFRDNAAYGARSANLQVEKVWR